MFAAVVSIVGSVIVISSVAFCTLLLSALVTNPSNMILAIGGAFEVMSSPGSVVLFSKETIGKLWVT